MNSNLVVDVLRLAMGRIVVPSRGRGTSAVSKEFAQVNDQRLCKIFPIILMFFHKSTPAHLAISVPLMAGGAWALKSATFQHFDAI
jgi:hypothetical protein